MNDKLKVTVFRENNNVYGNPVYRVYPENFSYMKVDSVNYNNVKKGYWKLVSYNIKESINDLLKELEEKGVKPNKDYYNSFKINRI